ncbi:MAG: hypothetical protein ACYTAS_13615, partial [Planctomycetota bacterium]
MAKSKDKVDSSSPVVFLRGGQEVSLFRSPSLISVRLGDGAVLPSLPGRISGELGIPPTVRFVGRYPGQRTAVFHCP